ncbi:uncharacterized protein LOC111029082 [Myzus persicae]|uniref:uncharacterized protein LOC111029082 n=1 Tax=Myzus persicae TaxID=13164 RepID=UPI000B9316D8|nr:uncharacterized protein LOC111029082 [Myzus persicae]
MGLLVDIVLQGCGTTNNGNTARKFFKNAEKSAEITGLNINLIKRFGTILTVMASGYEINTDAFETYGIQTAKLFVELYPWYYMPTSVHKILLHEADVIRHAILPIVLTKHQPTTMMPHYTLQDKVKKIKDGKIKFDSSSASKELGCYKKFFNLEQENVLAEYIKDMESRLFGLTQQSVRKLAFELADRNGIQHTFNKNTGMAGKDWLKGFLNRHSELSVRAPEPTSAARAMGFNQPVVMHFYDLLKQCYDKYKFSADTIFNVDESGLSNVAKSRAKIIAHKGRKQVGKLSSAERGQNVTVTICMSASGNFIPPLMIFLRVRINPDFIDGAPPATLVVCHPSGWMQSHIFVQWLEHFIKQTNPTESNPVLPLLDGHATHVKNLDIIDLTRKNNVIILCFPPHTTHRLQPLDLSFMGPLSTFYSQQLDYWLVNHPGRVVVLRQISKIFGEAYKKAANIRNACFGFKKTGIFLYDPEVFTEADFAAAETTNQIQEPTRPVVAAYHIIFH